MSGEVLPGCIGMDDDDDGVLNGTTNLAGEFVCASYPFRQRNIFFLRNKDLDFVAAQAQVFCGGVNDDTVEFVLSEASVRRAFAGGVDAMTGVEDYLFHDDVILV